MKELKQLIVSFFLILGINGEATLLSVRPTTVNTTILPLNQFGQVDRPVITTFKRYAPIIYDYHFSDGAVIGATSEHPFYSVDRQAYIPVGELQIGEQVMTAGEKVVKFIAGKQRDRGEPVYNFEVWREHNYYVGSKNSGEFLLVHNSCFPDAKQLAKILGITENAIHDLKKVIKKDWEKEWLKVFPNFGGNPDIGISDSGKLLLKSRLTGDIFDTNFAIINYID